MIPIATDSRGVYRHIGEITDKNRNDEYRCIGCGEIVKPRSIKEDNIMQPHFYHVHVGDCSPETVWHKFYKNWLLIPGNKFMLNYGDYNLQYTVRGVEIEQPYQTKFGTYVPDITVHTEEGEDVFIEINYSSKKNPDDYLGKWSELNIDVAEINVKSFYRLDYDLATDVFNVIYHDGNYIGEYKKLYKNDLYYEHVHKYKDMIPSLENLDWFWISLREYKRGFITKDDIAESFECMDFDEQALCVKMSKSMKCVDVCEDLQKSSFEKFSKYVSETLKYCGYDNFGDLAYSFELVHITPYKYKIGIFPSEFETWVNFKKSQCGGDCLSCNGKCYFKKYTDDVVILNRDCCFTEANYEFINNLVFSNLFGYYVLETIQRIEYNYINTDAVIKKKQELKCFLKSGELKKELDSLDLNVFKENYLIFKNNIATIDLVYSNNIDEKYLYHLFEDKEIYRAVSLLSKVEPSFKSCIINYLKNSLMSMCNSGSNLYRRMYKECVQEFVDSRGYAEYDFLSPLGQCYEIISKNCKYYYNKIQDREFARSRARSIEKLLKTRGKSEYVKYSVIRFSKGVIRFNWYHIDLNVCGVVLIDCNKINQKSDEEIILEIINGVIEDCSEEINRICPKWLMIY